MNHGKVRNLVAAAITYGFISVTGQVASAGTLHNGWNYVSDPNYDSLAGDGRGGIIAGGTIYEIYGMAIKDDVDSDSIWVAINSNLPIAGRNTGPFDSGFPISNGNIGWGDLLFDFSGLGNFKAANDASSLFGIRFAAGNDSKVSRTGVYSNVKAVSVVAQNGGWSNFYNHNINGVLPRTNRNAATGELAWNDRYYSPYTSLGDWDLPQTLIPNVIASGTKIGDITLLNSSQLSAAGFSPAFLPAVGSQTFGFKFAKSLLPQADYLATLILECNNDAIAIKGTTKVIKAPEKVPEPSTILSLGIMALVFGTNRLGKQFKVS
ncbi:XDD3 family exosortase-dependent surface protein [Floridanema evergladense]|uniref:XDD3 family exosortase-dependent surface protein n=1 Tax=Floridaenema evergladense BLCC-F167 TaxID=3153639 RepID=A0ABV4WI71_9CYAN